MYQLKRPCIEDSCVQPRLQINYFRTQNFSPIPLNNDTSICMPDTPSLSRRLLSLLLNPSHSSSPLSSHRSGDVGDKTLAHGPPPAPPDGNATVAVFYPNVDKAAGSASSGSSKWAAKGDDSSSHCRTSLKNIMPLCHSRFVWSSDLVLHSWVIASTLLL